MATEIISRYLRKSAPLLMGLMIPLLIAAAPVRVDRLSDAMRDAYRTNPTLAAERASVRVVDEDVEAARARGRPRIGLSGSYDEDVKRPVRNVLLPDRTLGASLAVTMPLYRGGGVRNAIKAGTLRSSAERAMLRSTVVDLFVDVTIAYNDVLRDQAVVRLNERNVATLETTLRAAFGRFQVGDLTITDVAQTKARLAVAQGNLRSARATLSSSREEFVRIVGRAPGDVIEPVGLARLPNSAEAAVLEAMKDNAALTAARQRSMARGYDVKVARAARLPQLNAVAGGTYFNYLDSVEQNLPIALRQTGSAVQLGLSLTIPLYQGGQPASDVRRAYGEQNVAIEQETEIERSVAASARTAFGNWRAALDVIVNAEVAIEANQLALRGTRAEHAVGNRTLLDVLDAERELLNSQVTRVSVRRDAYVAAFLLLATMGRADPDDLGIDGRQWNALEVRHGWSDWSDGEAFPRSSTGTATEPPQGGAVTSEESPEP